MKFYSNKFLISFLILTVLFYSFSAQTAEAGWNPFKAFKNIFKAVHNVLDTVFNVVLNTIIGISELALGNVLGVSWLNADGTCRLGNISSSFLKEYAKECGGDSGGGGGAAGSPTLQNQTATPILSSNGNCTTGFTLN